VTGAAVIWGTIGVATQAIDTLDNATSLFVNLARMLIATPTAWDHVLAYDWERNVPYSTA
jgi:hypothetical protein